VGAHAKIAVWTLVALCLTCAAHAENLLPAELATLDQAAALDHMWYLRSGPEVAANPDQHFRIVSTGAYSGAGCLQLTTYDSARSGMIFHGPAGEYLPGQRYVASAYVRATEETQLSIFIWTDDGELHPVDQIRETYTIGSQWRQVFAEGFLGKAASRASVLIRVGPGDPPARHVILVDEVKFEPGSEPTPSQPDPPDEPSEVSRTEVDYHLPFAATAPTVDGALGDGEWEGALELGGFTINDRDGTPPPQQTRVWMAYDAENLYAAAWCEEVALDKLTDLSRVRDRPDWGDDRIEFFFNVLGIPRTPTYYLSTNAFGVTADEAIGTGEWDPDLNIASGRDQRGWIIEMALPLAAMGKSHVAGEVWRMNIGRHHRTSHTASSQLARFEGSFHEPPHFVTMRFAPPDDPGELTLTCLTRGEMTPLGSWVGTNRAAYHVVNRSAAPANLWFSVESVIDGRVVAEQSMIRQVAPGETVIEQPYSIEASEGEVVIFRVTRLT